MRIQSCEIFQETYECCHDCGALQLAKAQELQHERGCSKDPDQFGQGTGWFYWNCQPGCLPDSEPFGPFESEQAAIDDATESEFIDSDSA